MKKNLLVLVLIAIVGCLYGSPDWDLYWEKIDNFDYSYFENDFQDNGNGLKEYGQYFTGDKNNDLAIQAAVKVSNLIESESMEKKDFAEYNYILAEIYLEQIVDAKSYMNFNGLYENAVENMLAYDSNNVRYLLNSAKSLVRFPSPRGIEEDGEKLLNDLSHENPNNTNVVFTVANRNFNNGNIEIAEEGFKKARDLNPNYKPAIEMLDSIELNNKNLTIRNITIKNDIKTSKNRVNKKLSRYIGEKLTFDLQDNINNDITKISSIGGAKIKGIQIDNGNVDLELTINEDNFRAMALIAGAGIGLDYSNKPLPAGGAAGFMYLDNNLLGTGIYFQLLTAAVFNQIEVKKHGLINDGIIDLKLSVQSLFLPIDQNYIKDGKEAKKHGKSSSHAFQVGLGREFDFGLTSFINYKVKIEPQEDVKGVTEKDDSAFHEVNGEFILNLAGDSFSALQTQEGFNLSFLPRMIYKPNYKTWGREGNLYKHDSNAAWYFQTQLGLYSNLGKSHNIGLNITHLGSINPYESERFRVGHGASPMDNYSLTGYLPGEIVVDNAFISNLKYTFIQNLNKLNFYGKYDLLVDTDNEKMYNGAALGVGAKLPWDIEMSAEAGVGFNADREELPGLVFSLMFMKMHVL